MKNLKKRWKLYGVAYFAALFTLVPSLASAYIDPSVTTYAIQAIAGVAVAAGAFFATYGRRMKKSWMRMLDIDENEKKTTEAPLEVTREDLKQELAQKREKLRQAVPGGKKKKSLKGRIITSLLCGFAPALALILRPSISFYLTNEGEYWFELGDVLPYLLLLFFGAAAAAALVHFLLPDGKKISLRLLFAAAAAAGTLCVFVQNYFMSSYLPALTGDELHWETYTTWKYLSYALWGGAFLLLPLLSLLRPRFMKSAVYGLLLFFLCAEAVSGTVEAVSATHTNKRIGTYFSMNGMNDTSEAGNVVVLVSDTFEGTYMNEILEEYPEVRDLLSDCTYYDNVTGISIFTHFSFAKLMTGQDFPAGKASEEGISYCFEHQTTLDRIAANGWDTAYYDEYSPVPEIRDKVINYSDERLCPDGRTAWKLANMLFRASLFRSAPHSLKPDFIVYTIDFEYMKYELKDACPYIENDAVWYHSLAENGLTPVAGRPRYSLVELFGVHAPNERGADFELLENPEEMTIEERKIQSARASLTLLRTYLDALKDAGTYDQTTVIMTADHGFDLRFYPVLLVKEAHRAEEGFRVDPAPISLQSDYEDLIAGLTEGKSFSSLAAEMTAEDRVRTALDFGGPTYWEKTDRRSVVEIRGEARDPASYYTARDEFLTDDAYPGRCEIDMPFFQDGRGNDTAAVYGLFDGHATGHSILFDAFLKEEESRPLVFRTAVYNYTEQAQRILFSLNGEGIGEAAVLEPGKKKVFSVPLPEGTYSRLSLQMDLPDAVLERNYNEGLGWNTYTSVSISEAGFYDSNE